MSTFGNNLKKVRKEKGFTLDRLADEVNRNYRTSLTKSTLSRWERGKADPQMSSLVAVARFLRVSIDNLYGEVSGPYKSAIIDCVRHLEDEKKLRIIWTFAKSLTKKEKSSDRVDARETEDNAKFNN